MKKMPAVKQVFPKILKKDLSAQEGATLIEIALYIALVVIVCIAVVASLGGKLQGVFTTIVNSL
jgi:Flp pilus assembly pilin Flp